MNFSIVAMRQQQIEIGLNDNEWCQQGKNTKIPTDVTK